MYQSCRVSWQAIDEFLTRRRMVLGHRVFLPLQLQFTFLFPPYLGIGYPNFTTLTCSSDTTLWTWKSTGFKDIEKGRRQRPSKHALPIDHFCFHSWPKNVARFTYVKNFQLHPLFFKLFSSYSSSSTSFEHRFLQAAKVAVRLAIFDVKQTECGTPLGWVMTV